MKYKYKISQMYNNGKTFCIVESTELNGCVAQGDTVEEALKEFEQNELEWLESAKEHNIPIPERKV
ncbi:MAG: type II toxin-antitoxin system HicB family antitoxin [Sphaerochaetaceae bacterium]